MSSTQKDFCHGCGLCCMHMRTPPFLGDDDPQWQALPQSLRDEIEAFMRSPRSHLNDWLAGGVMPCLWLDLATGQCRNYQWRPDVCRDFEVGSFECRRDRRLTGLTVEGMPVDRKGGDMAEWPADMRVRELPEREAVKHA